MLVRRKLIKQGKGALTVSLPKKWVDVHGLEPGEDIFVHEQENDLIIEARETSKESVTRLSLNEQSKETFRSLIGALYRGGYDVVEVGFNHPRISPNLQSAVDTLYGFEIFDISERGCVIKNMYKSEATELHSHLLRMVHTINTMEHLIISDIKKKEAKQEIVQLRNNILKQRDLIVRTIKKQKLLDNKHFPYYTIALSLWGVARNYHYMYHNAQEISANDKKILTAVSEYFKKSFSKFNQLDMHAFMGRHHEFSHVRKMTLDALQKKPTIVASFSMGIVSSIQLADSALYLLNHE